ncbi:MAG: hypothetical protein AABY28_05015 [Candidatus Omnitrophota bacterium]
MDPIEKKKYEKLLGKDYIERKAKRQVVDKDGKEEPIIDIQKVTGLDETGGITDAELDRIKIFGCGHPSEGRANLGGECAICKALFCNKIIGDKYSCYRRCIRCKRMICMTHVKARPGEAVYCSLWCFLLYHPLLLGFLIIAGLIVFNLLARACSSIGK